LKLLSDFDRHLSKRKFLIYLYQYDNPKFLLQGFHLEVYCELPLLNITHFALQTRYKRFDFSSF